MEIARRYFVQLTTAGLLHLTAQVPVEANGAAIDSLIRRAGDRGHTDLGWLKSYHTFSFGNYYDQRHVGFRSLRVINDDRITAGRGFPTHPHRDMEILSYVLEGSLQHRDSTGRGSVVTTDDVQIMSAGSGITHSEYNPSPTVANHFLQIWIQPSQRGLRPRYQQQRLASGERQDNLRLLASPDGQTGSVRIHQDALVHGASLSTGGRLQYAVERDRHAWLQVAKGRLIVNGTTLVTGDAIATSRPTSLQIEGVEQAEILLFDLG